MSSTAFSITSSAYVDCGAGPLAAVRKAGEATGNLLAYCGPTTPGDDANSFAWNSPSPSLDYGGTDKLFLKAVSGSVTVVVVK